MVSGGEKMGGHTSIASCAGHAAHCIADGFCDASKKTLISLRDLSVWTGDFSAALGFLDR